MAGALKIYACSGVGNPQPKQKKSVVGYTYWTDNTNSISNTQAVNTLLSLINLNNSEVMYLSMPKSEKIKKLNTIDFLVVCLDAARKYAGNDEGLWQAAQAIGAMSEDGLFAYSSLSNSHRDKHLDGLLATFDYYVQSSKRGGDDSFYQWWDEHVQKRNRVGLNSIEQEEVRKALKKGISGIGETLNWEDSEELAQYLNKASEYFLYLYFTEEQLSELPRKFRTKRDYQQQVYDYCKGLFVKQFGSEADMQNIIRAGIIGYFHAQPEEVCALIASGDYKGAIGPVALASTMTIAELIQIILICAAIVTAIIALICDAAVRAQTAKYKSLDAQIINAAAADASDFDDLDKSGFSTINSGSLVTIALIAVGLLLIMKR